jgi:DNA-binding XRE family transcriptional regulator
LFIYSVPHAYPPIVVASRKSKPRVILRHRRLIGDAIRFRRKKGGLTQAKLAEIAELHTNYIGEVERGEKIISIEALLRIAKAVKTPIHKFFRDI